MRVMLIAILFSLAAGQATAFDLTGIWVSHAKIDQVLKVERTPAGYRGIFYIPGRDAGGTPASVMLKGRIIDFHLNNKLGVFDGRLRDKNSFVGTGQGGGPSEQRTFTRTLSPISAIVDPVPHKNQFVSIANNVSLEVLDWGGRGPPLVFLPGWGNTAHVFDGFAPRFTANHHVYGITRRGFGLSSTPPPTAENFDPDVMGDDVLAVLSALKIDRPVLVGHSVAGQEMSSIGSRHPERVAGLVYLDAAFAFAYYDPSGGYTVEVVSDSVRRNLERLMSAGPVEARALTADIIHDLPNLEHALQRNLLSLYPDTPLAQRQTYQFKVQTAMSLARRKYTEIKAPLLAIIAVPYKCVPDCSVAEEKAWGEEVAMQADAFQKGNPRARIVRLPYADHYVFRSNANEVEREIKDFLVGLPQ